MVQILNSVNKYYMKKIFVTGANGFISYYLVEKLVLKGYKVKALSIYNL